MTRSQALTQRIIEQYGYMDQHQYGPHSHMGHPTMQPHHPYQTHHYQAAMPAHHSDSHAGMEHDEAPPKKSGGKVKSFLAGTAVGAAGAAYGIHKLVQAANAHQGK